MPVRKQGTAISHRALPAASRARVNGKRENTILKTYPQVNQFWTYDAAGFITRPPFARDYPPSKYLE